MGLKPPALLGNRTMSTKFRTSHQSPLSSNALTEATKAKIACCDSRLNALGAMLSSPSPAPTGKEPEATTIALGIRV